jgi:hypothetical protein
MRAFRCTLCSLDRTPCRRRCTRREYDPIQRRRSRTPCWRRHTHAVHRATYCRRYRSRNVCHRTPGQARITRRALRHTWRRWPRTGAGGRRTRVVLERTGRPFARTHDHRVLTPRSRHSTLRACGETRCAAQRTQCCHRGTPLLSDCTGSMIVSTSGVRQHTPCAYRAPPAAEALCASLMYRSVHRLWRAFAESDRTLGGPQRNPITAFDTDTGTACHSQQSVDCRWTPLFTQVGATTWRASRLQGMNHATRPFA